jgi:hypothetical protein
LPLSHHAFKEALVSTLFVLPSFLLSATFWTIKALFFSGWFLARWITYLTWPLWAAIVGLGALCGLI